MRYLRHAVVMWLVAQPALAQSTVELTGTLEQARAAVVQVAGSQGLRVRTAGDFWTVEGLPTGAEFRTCAAADTGTATVVPRATGARVALVVRAEYLTGGAACLSSGRWEAEFAAALRALGAAGLPAPGITPNAPPVVAAIADAEADAKATPTRQGGAFVLGALLGPLGAILAWASADGTDAPIPAVAAQAEKRGESAALAYRQAYREQTRAAAKKEAAASGVAGTLAGVLMWGLIIAGAGR